MTKTPFEIMAYEAAIIVEEDYTFENSIQIYDQLKILMHEVHDS